MLSVDEINRVQMNSYSSARIELQFDYTWGPMAACKTASVALWFIVAVFLIGELIAALSTATGLIGFWIFVEYAQLIAYLPLLSVRMVPMLYEGFKPFLTTHLIWPRGSQFLGVENDAISFYSKNYFFYGVSGQKLSISISLIAGGFFILGCAHLIFFLCHKYKCCCKSRKSVANLELILQHFKWNVYIRWFMLGYLDMVFIASARIFDSDQETTLQLVGTVIGILVLVGTLVIPILALYYLYAHFDRLQEDEFKKPVSQLVYCLDEGQKSRLFTTAFYFARRWMTGLMLVMSLNSQAVFMQYVLIIVFSAIYLIYLLSYEPYVLHSMNIYVISMELVYVVLGGACFLFTDSTPDILIKTLTAVVCMILICVTIAINLGFGIWLLCTGRAKLDEKIATETEQRRAKEAAANIAKHLFHKKLAEGFDEGMGSKTFSFGKKKSDKGAKTETADTVTEGVVDTDAPL